MTPEALADALIPALEKLIAKHMAPLQERIAQLEGVEVPTAEETAAEAARLLLGGEGIKSLIDLEMQAYVATNPPQKGEKGDPGQDGKDGIGMAGALIDRDGSLTVTMTNGEVKSLGPVVGRDGQPGKDGADGLGFDDLTVSFNGEAIVHEYKRGEKSVVQTFPVNVMRHIGFWREGMEAKSGNTTTEAGSLWLCLNDTTERPSYQAKDWILAARAGRNGLDKTDPKASEPVKLHG